LNNISENTDKKSLNNVKIGENVKIYDFVNAYNCSINDDSRVGTFVEIQKGVTIGKNCKISSHSFICEGVTIEDNVFIGHNVSFINDMIPRAVNLDGSIKTDDDWTIVKTMVKKGASIGTSATILGGVIIGENALIGAGSVVTKDVLPNTVVAGNPAKEL
jgi:acetyltransferase-like isoleucine patch superfamily enzyme